MEHSKAWVTTVLRNTLGLCPWRQEMKEINICSRSYKHGLGDDIKVGTKFYCVNCTHLKRDEEKEGAVWHCLCTTCVHRVACVTCNKTVLYEQDWLAQEERKKVYVVPCSCMSLNFEGRQGRCVTMFMDTHYEFNVI